MRQLLYKGKEYYYHGKVMEVETTSTGKQVSVSKICIEDMENGQLSTAPIKEVKFTTKP